MTNPTNGATTAVPDVVGQSFSFGGKVNAPKMRIDVEVLESPTLDPAIGPWALVASTQSNATPDPTEVWNDETPSYSWNATGRPVPTEGQRARWPAGGVARFRAVSVSTNGTKTPIATFDDVNFGCVLAQAGAGTQWNVAGDNCEGMGKRTATMVHTAILPDPAPAFGFLTDKGVGFNTVTAAYYANISAPSTLAAFKLNYNLLVPQASARYFNDGDLGLGREMACSEFTNSFGPGVACYVRNYSAVPFTAPNFNEDPNAVLALTTAANGPFATVAMVYQQFLQTKFIVYNANETLAYDAQLDAAGDNKSIPQNCLACHGINSTFNTQTFLIDGKPEFLPFDPYAFKFSANAPWRLVDQQESFRKLNAMILKTQVPPATTELVNGMYAPLSVNTPGATANNNYVPPGWHDASSPNFDGKSLYNGVVKKYCRTCHVSADSPLLDFRERSDFDTNVTSILSTVCGTKKMPHAERVQKKFWQSGARAYLLTGLPGMPYGDPLLECKP